jgi:hypothetical protein
MFDSFYYTLIKPTTVVWWHINLDLNMLDTPKSCESFDQNIRFIQSVTFQFPDTYANEETVSGTVV